ncbi:hypothetical protein [Microvirga sp. 3-52]|nr:hypothetical protein [Microvirga sp. 3-52]
MLAAQADAQDEGVLRPDGEDEAEAEQETGDEGSDQGDGPNGI